MMARRSRPAGITILGVLEILIGVSGLLASIAIIGVSALFSAIPTIGSLLGTIGVIIGGVVLFFSLVWLATGVGFLHGKGWSWTLGMIFSILSLLGAISLLAIDLVTSGVVIGILFWGFMIYYLTRNHVKIFFGKGGGPVNQPYIMPYTPGPQFNQPQTMGTSPVYGQPATPAPTLGHAPTPPRPSTPVSQIGPGPAPSSPASSDSLKAVVSCPYCGSKLTMGSPKCMTCGATI